MLAAAAAAPLAAAQDPGERPYVVLTPPTAESGNHGTGDHTWASGPGLVLVWGSDRAAIEPVGAGAWGVGPSTVPAPGEKVPQPNDWYAYPGLYAEGPGASASLPGAGAGVGAPSVGAWGPFVSVPNVDDWHPQPDQWIPNVNEWHPDPNQWHPDPNQWHPQVDSWQPRPDDAIPLPDQWVPQPNEWIPAPDQWMPNPNDWIPDVDSWYEFTGADARAPDAGAMSPLVRGGVEGPSAGLDGDGGLFLRAGAWGAGQTDQKGLFAGDRGTTVVTPPLLP